MPQIERISPERFADEDGPAAAVRRIAAACDAADGVETLNEQVRLALKHRGLADARLWLAGADGGSGSAATGLALLHGGDQLELAVHPEHRGQGLGTALAAEALAGVDHVEAWSHADHPAAARIADRFAVPRERDLVIMSRPTATPLDDVRLPEDVRIRSFDPADEAALLEVNAAAFRHHPEQGGMSAADFRERTGEDWFDPEGLFLAVPADPDDDRLLGFHWTKLHRDEGGPAYGEVYVVAVNPKAAGRGLGRELTRAGLAHLASTGVDRVILYVESDNVPAVALYEGLGFDRVRTEVQYVGVPRLP